MKFNKKKIKLIAIGAIAGAAIMGVGAVALVSKGFKNMDVRDWVGGYEHVLEVDEDAQYLCPDYANVEGLEWSFNQDKRAVIKFKSEEGVHASAKLFDQDGKEFKVENFTLSSKISIKDDGMAGFAFGMVGSNDAISFMLDYDKQAKTLRVVSFYNDNVDYSFEMEVPTCRSETLLSYSGWYSLSYYGLDDLNDIKFSVTKTLTANGSKFVVKVGNKTIDFVDGSIDSNGDYVYVDGENDMNVTKGAYPVYLDVKGTTEATFKDVKWSE